MSKPVSNLGTAQWRELDRQHHLEPFTDYKALHEQGARIITRADGIYVWDSEGERLLDGMAGLWCVNVGYGRRELAEVAHQQMLELPFYNTFFQTSHPPAIELASVLAEVTPAQFSRVFFCNSGSEANDTVVRMVRHYWAAAGEPQRQVIISRHNAYHGSTMAGASLGGMQPMHKQGGLPIPGIEHIEQPYWYKLGRDRSAADFGREAASWLEQRIEEVGAEHVAAFIGEPIQGAGGVIVPPETYWPEIQRICRKYGIVLVADEVICGFGRTGRWFGSETFGIEPDLMPIAKGLSSGYLPIGGVMVSDRIAEVLIDKGGEFIHGFTYSGHPTACAVAAANIRIIRDEGLVDRVRDDIGPYFQARLRELADNPIVGEVRGIGLIAAIELVKDKATRELWDEEGKTGTRCRGHSLANGLIMRAVNDSMVLSPPLIISRGQVDELVDKVRAAVDATARELGAS